MLDNLTFPLQTSAQDCYQAVIRRYPLLDAETELKYATAFYEHNDLDAAHTLVVSNLRGVLYVARKYLGYGLPFADLVQEGSIGLMRAVKRFDPYKRVRLFAYAMPWIKAEIQRYVVNNWRLVKVATTDSRKKLFFNLRSLKSKLMPLGSAESEAIAKELNVPVSDVLAMDQYMGLPDASLSFDVDGAETVLMLPAPAEDQPDLALESEENERLRREGLERGMQLLDERSRAIVVARFMDEPPKTLSELAKKYGVSIERVRQIESNALKKVRAELAHI